MSNHVIYDRSCRLPLRRKIVDQSTESPVHARDGLHIVGKTNSSCGTIIMLESAQSSTLCDRCQIYFGVSGHVSAVDMRAEHRPPECTCDMSQLPSTLAMENMYTHVQQRISQPAKLRTRFCKNMAFFCLYRRSNAANRVITSCPLK